MISVAVVGIQYNYSSFYSNFFNAAEQNNVNCLSDVIDCYVLDNNAFVIVSEIYTDVGMFFGEINDDLLQDMVSVGLYRKIKFFDYQSICIEIINTTSSSITLMTPLIYLKNILMWLSSHLLSIYLNLFYDLSWVSTKDNYQDSIC